MRPPTTLNTRAPPPAELSNQKVSELIGAVHSTLATHVRLQLEAFGLKSPPTASPLAELTRTPLLGLRFSLLHGAMLLGYAMLACLASMSRRVALWFTALAITVWYALTITCGVATTHHAPGPLGFDLRDMLLYAVLVAYNAVYCSGSTLTRSRDPHGCRVGDYGKGPVKNPVVTDPTVAISNHQSSTGADAFATYRGAWFMISTVARLYLTCGTVR